MSRTAPEVEYCGDCDTYYCGDCGFCRCVRDGEKPLPGESPEDQAERAKSAPGTWVPELRDLLNGEDPQ